MLSEKDNILKFNHKIKFNHPIVKGVTKIDIKIVMKVL